MKLYRIRHIAETASTNDDVKEAAAAGEAEGLVIHADMQTAGRGRGGRPWVSPPGNLYTSILLRPVCDLAQAHLYVFAAALAIYDTVHKQLLQTDIKIKWPNDVLVEGKKISGILLESSTTAKGNMEWQVVGIGLNVEHYPQTALYPATSLRAMGAAVKPLSDILETLLDRFFEWKAALEKEGFAPLRKAWLERAQTGPLSARLPHETLQGDFADLDKDGRLILRLANGKETAISAGDVFFANMPSAQSGPPAGTPKSR